MNMGYNRYQEQDFEDQDEARGGKDKLPRTQRRPAYGRSGRAPAAFNGIHRRRNKRVSW